MTNERWKLVRIFQSGRWNPGWPFCLRSPISPARLGTRARDHNYGRSGLQVRLMNKPTPLASLKEFAFRVRFSLFLFSEPRELDIPSASRRNDAAARFNFHWN